MGERGPKQQFTDISCPNEGCKKYGRTDGDNIIANGTYQTKAGTVRKFKCKECGRVLMTVLALLIRVYIPQERNSIS